MNIAIMQDGIINLDTERGEAFGFTSEKYEGWLWKTGAAIYISFIVSKRRGNFRELVRRIHEQGYAVKVPTPLGRMRAIVEKNGYERTVEDDLDFEEPCEVWILKPGKNK